MRLTLRPNLRSYDLIRRLGLASSFSAPWAIEVGDASVTIGSFPVASGPWSIAAGDGSATIISYPEFE